MQTLRRRPLTNRRRSQVALGWCFVALACVLAGWLLEGQLLATEAVTGPGRMHSATVAPPETVGPPSPLISPDQKLVLQGAIAGFVLAIFIRLCFDFLRPQPVQKQVSLEPLQPSGS